MALPLSLQRLRLGLCSPAPPASLWMCPSELRRSRALLLPVKTEFPMETFQESKIKEQ